MRNFACRNKATFKVVSVKTPKFSETQLAD